MYELLSIVLIAFSILQIILSYESAMDKEI